MEKYANEDWLKRKIMDQSGHLFIYGYTNDYRSEFLKKLESEYPVVADSNKPVALYFDSLGIQKASTEYDKSDRILAASISERYLSFSIVAKLLERTECDESTLSKRLSRLIDFVNMGKNPGYKDIQTISSLLEEIKKSREFYYENYIKYINGSISHVPTGDISIPFLKLEFIIRQYKRGLNINSHLGVIIDKKKELELSSIMAINNLIGARISGDLSIMVAAEPGDWPVYYNTDDRIIEEPHDYRTLELDGSFDEYMRKLKAKYYNDK